MLADWNATGSLRNTACYILNKAKAKLIDKNLPGRSAGDLAAGMELLAQQNPNGMLRNVGHHFKLSFADGQHPTDEQLVEASRTFLQEFGIERDNHPYLAAVHRDTRHTHAHILVASDGYDGKTLDGAWTKRRTKEATIRAASRLEWTSPTPNRRGLYFSFDELQQMAKMQQPTEQLARWAEENQFDLSSWNALDWQCFSQHPGVVLSQLEQQRELPTAIAEGQPSAPARQLERVSKPLASTPSESDYHSEPAALTSPTDQIAQSLIPLMNWLLHQHNLKVIRGRYWDVNYIDSDRQDRLVMLHKSSGWQLQAIQSDASWQIAAVSEPPSESVVMAMRNLLQQLQDFSTAQQRSQQQQQKLRLSEREL